MVHKILFKDSSGKKSVTMTAFVWGSLVVNLKLILSGMTVAGVTLAGFSGSEYGVAMGALGAIYVMRRSTDPSVSKPVEGNSNG